MAPEASNGENVYVMDPESATEMARLMLQDRLLTQAMGGVFPERSNLTGIHRILDLGCGPGGWVLDVAFASPKIEIVGVDISRIMIEYARAQAWSRGLNNARFQLMDIIQPFDFPDQSFDLVNARWISFIPKGTWPALIQECFRVLRPGGILRLTECELPMTTSPARDRLTGMLAQAFWRLGKNFSTDGRTFGITPMLGGMLEEGGFVNIQQKPHVVDVSQRTPSYESFRQNAMVAYKTLQPFFLSAGLSSQEELDKLYDQMLIETMLDSFRGIYFMLTAWGERSQRQDSQ